MHQASDWLGRSARHATLITGDLIDRFADLSGDVSPIHVSDAEAQRRGFKGRIAHGLLLGSLISNVIGNELPGADGVLQKITLAFRNPCYEGERITIEATVSEFFESVQALILQVRVTNGDGLLLVSGSIQSGLREHGAGG